MIIRPNVCDMRANLKVPLLLYLYVHLSLAVSLTAKPNNHLEARHEKRQHSSAISDDESDSGGFGENDIEI